MSIARNFFNEWLRLHYLWVDVGEFSLSNYISAEEVCDCTGKRGTKLRVAERGSIPEGRE
jgi:hypothetical protein